MMGPSDPRLTASTTVTRSGIPSGSRSPICQMPVQGIRRGSAQDGRIIMMEPADLPAGRRPAGGHWQKVPGPGRPRPRVGFPGSAAAVLSILGAPVHGSWKALAECGRVK
jgi:hypothetical protein